MLQIELNGDEVRAAVEAGDTGMMVKLFDLQSGCFTMRGQESSV